MSLCLLATLALGAAAAAPTPDLPVREVTVFSDRARVVRRGTVTLGAETRVRLPTLPPTLDPASVRLEAKPGTVRRVEVRRAEQGELPRTEADRLAEELERAQDAERELTDRIAILEAEAQLLRGVRLEAPPADPKALPALFDPAGWKAGLAFLDTRAQAVDEALRGLKAQLHAQEKKTAPLSESAARRFSADPSRLGWVAEAVVDARGPVELTLGYVAAGARWYPTYDVRLEPGAAEVQLDFAGLVSQETGEDWLDARLELSTAVPSASVEIPQLRSWRIGERRQFVPTSVARAPGPDSGAADGKQGMDGKDAGVIHLGVGTQKVINVPGIARVAIGDPGVTDVKPLGSTQLLLVGTAEGRSVLKVWKSDGTLLSYRLQVRKKDPNESIMELQKLLDDCEGVKVKMVGDRIFVDGRTYNDDDRERIAKVVALYPSVVDLTKPASPPSEADAKVIDLVPMNRPGGAEKPAAPPRRVVALGVPAGWAPSFASGLPAAVAGGYDFVYPSARPETVRSGVEARRVVLHAARLPAAVRLSVVPGLSLEAFRVAELTNTSDKPLLQGKANLFVGADLQGQAVIETTAVGQGLVLPLGMDEAVQVRRRVEVVTREVGVFSKEDVTNYQVEIELLNQRPTALAAQVQDQLPLQGDATVQVALESVQPAATPTKEEGRLEWRLKLEPGVKQVVRFAYTVTRPRGAQLRQW